MKSVHVYISGKNVTFPDNFRILADESNEILSMYKKLATKSMALKVVSCYYVSPLLISLLESAHSQFGVKNYQLTMWRKFSSPPTPVKPFIKAVHSKFYFF